MLVCLQVCLIARVLNECLVNDHDGITSLDNVLYRCADKIKYIYSLDLISTFCQMPFYSES